MRYSENKGCTQNQRTDKERLQTQEGNTSFQGKETDSPEARQQSDNKDGRRAQELCEKGDKAVGKEGSVQRRSAIV